MVAIPQEIIVPECPTVRAAIDALGVRCNREPRRRYLGMSAIGDKCSRKLWYGLYSEDAPLPISGDGFMMINDGHRGEDVVADLLRGVSGIELHVGMENETTGKFGQIRCEDFDGQFAGHLDGAILGLKQAPKTWHVWENKVVNETKWNKLKKFIETLGEKNALRAWDAIYYAQAVLYMHYQELTRHYITVATPGVRKLMGVRTNADPIHAAELIQKAGSIIRADRPPAKLSDKPDWFECRFCQWRVTCHGFDAWEGKK